MAVRHLLTAAGALVAAELALRAVPDLRKTQAWHDPHAQVKERQMRDLSRGGGSRLVFAGSSIIATGLAPEIIAATADPHRAYNAGINRGVSTVLEHWVLERVVPLLRPSAVVICAGTLELNDRSILAADVEQAYFTAPIHRSWLARRLLGMRLLYAALVARRRLLQSVGRQPSTTSAVGRLDRLVPRRTFGEFHEWLDMTPFGQNQIYLDGVHRPSTSRDAKFRSDIVNHFAVGGRQTEALDRLVAELAARGIDVVLLFLAHSEEYVGLHPRGQADVDDARRVVRAVASHHTVPFVDLSGCTLTTAELVDCIHPNGSGSRLLSEAARTALLEMETLRPLLRELSAT